MLEETASEQDDGGDGEDGVGEAEDRSEGGEGENDEGRGEGSQGEEALDARSAECGLEGCARPVYVEAASGRVHLFCCRAHAVEAGAAARIEVPYGTAVVPATLPSRVQAYD